MGPDEVYTMFKLNGSDAAAGYTMREPERSMAPPHWNLYIAVGNADETAKRASELGGTVLLAPFDVMTFGRMAVIQDPTGAVFCIWQAYDHKGITVSNEPGAFCWAELSSPAVDRAKPFYETLLGWKIGTMEGFPPDYEVITTGGVPVAGIEPPATRSPDVPAYWIPYFQVSDVDATVQKASGLGGRVCVGPVDLPPVRLALLTDPQGAAFATIRM